MAVEQKAQIFEAVVIGKHGNIEQSRISTEATEERSRQWKDFARIRMQKPSWVGLTHCLIRVRMLIKRLIHQLVIHIGDRPR